MLFTSWLRKKTGPHSNRTITGRRPARLRPGLEALEDRSIPAILAVTTPLDVIDPHDGLLSLREAILTANADNGANTILLPGGTYTLALPGADEDAGYSGDLDIIGHLTIRGAGAGATIIDGAELDRVFQVHESARVRISGLTIQRGAAGRFVEGDQVVYSANGGGIANAGILTVRDCTITGNSAGAGGGIMNGGTLTVIGSTLSNNYSYFGYGGGIANVGILKVANSTFSDNFGAEYGGAISTSRNAAMGQLQVKGSIFSGNSAQIRGGAIYVDTEHRAIVAIETSTFTGNTAGGYGGAVNVFQGNATIADCVLSGNTSEGWGGAIHVEAILTIRNCTISGNSALQGGGISSLLGDVTVRNSTLLDNSAVHSGGAIYNDGTLLVQESTISGNSAEFGGGIATDLSFATATVRNSTIVGNFASLGGDVFNAGLLFVFDSVIGDRHDA